MQRPLSILLVAAATTMAAASAPAETPPPISADFPFEKRFVEVNGTEIAYVEEGAGAPVLFVHGNPTSSYLWRNIIPFVSDTHRAIAVDLVGMGDSGKPDIAYTFQDHYAHLEGFIDALGLEDLVLVLHDWGGGLGTAYAMRHPDNVRALALMEAAAPPALPVPSWEAITDPKVRETFQGFRHPEFGPKIVLEENAFVEGLLPSAVVRPLSEAEMDAYRAPFPTPASRKPILVWPNEIPIEGQPARNAAVMTEVAGWLATSEQPKLVFYASPGLIISPEAAEFVAKTYNNVETRFVGSGVHYLQEDHPEVIGRNLSDWLRDRVN